MAAELAWHRKRVLTWLLGASVALQRSPCTPLHKGNCSQVEETGAPQGTGRARHTRGAQRTHPGVLRIRARRAYGAGAKKNCPVIFDSIFNPKWCVWRNWLRVFVALRVGKCFIVLITD